ncbi:MAG: FIG00729359: hypothetical protein, partial [uncultured Thiotrichaceae bacterium]
MKRLKQNVLAAVIAATYTVTMSAATASSHREAPFITENPKVDATDFYMFRSYEPGREAFVTLVANYNPLQDAYGGPNYFSLAQDALYEIHIDNNGDAIEDLTFQFQFDNKLGNKGAGAALAINGKNVAVPLKNIGGVTSSDNSKLNFTESYTVNVVSGDRRTGTKAAVVGSNNGLADFAKPYDNVGEKTF